MTTREKEFLKTEIQKYKNISIGTKKLFAIIIDIVNMNGQCFQSESIFAKKCNTTKVNIKKWLNCLKANEHITIEKQKGKCQIITLTYKITTNK